MKARRPALLTRCLSVVLGAAVVWVAGAEAVSAQKKRAVIELFTSQGCAACPAADRLLTQLAQRDDVIALTLAVSYWDHFGWKDTLAIPENSERQRRYAKKGQGRAGVYTPQVVVNGLADCVGSNLAAIEAAMHKTSRAFEQNEVALTAELRGNRLRVEAGMAPPGSQSLSADVIVIAATKTMPVAIERGENAGKTVTYSNVVRSIVDGGDWIGRPASFDIAFERKGADFLVVLLQDSRSGLIIGATEVEIVAKAGL
jgi:hypothetical protein